MNNDTSNRSTPATASPLTVKEAAPPVMIKKIGKTTYRVKIHFSETSKETMSDKIKRLILNDSEKKFLNTLDKTYQKIRSCRQWNGPGPRICRRTR